MVHLDEVDDLMNQMMKTPIFLPSDKYRLLEDENKILLDPNLIMDARHQIIRDMLSDSEGTCSALVEAKRLLKEEEIKEICLKKEQHFLETQLRRFENELHKSRPKFQKQYGCNKQNLANSNDENFWGTTRKLRMEIRPTNKSKAPTSGIKSKQTSIEEKLSSLIEHTAKSNIKEEEKETCENIKVTIKDKICFDLIEDRLNLMKNYFELLRKNAIEERQSRNMKVKVQQNMALRLLRRCFRIWKSHTKNMKNITKIKKEEQEKSHDRKIEIFITEIVEKQKELTKLPKQQIRNDLFPKNVQENEDKKKLKHKKQMTIESPAKHRLNAQKVIIEKQKSKLAEQNKIIEELRLKQIQEELTKMDNETISTAKETLMHCGQETRRTLIQLMRQAGYRDKSMRVPQQVPNPPKFLGRMEARAEARRERLKKVEEIRRKNLEEQKLKEEAAKLEEEEKRKKLQQEAVREARRLREEQEKCRVQKMERLKELNSRADQFYQKYLFRHYVKKPCIKLSEIRHNSIKTADDHYKKSLLLRNITAWRRETQKQYQVKVELAMSVYDRNLLWYAFKNLKEIAKEENRKSQVAKDFYDMKLQEKSFHALRSIFIELKLKHLENEEMAEEHYEYKIKSKYFNKLRDYPTIAEMVKESEKQRRKWREIVQEIVPDFDPKERGVALED